MLQKLELRNFKGFRQQSFDLAPITVLVGRNGTGKSSVSKRWRSSSNPRSRGGRYSASDGATVLAELGSFADLVHMGDSALPIELKHGCSAGLSGASSVARVCLEVHWGFAVCARLPMHLPRKPRSG